jgi:hypothetical protein
LSSPPEWTAWGGGYEYVEGGGYEYGWGAGHPTNHQLGEEDMNMVGSHMVEVADIDTVEEHKHLMNHWPEVEVEGTDMAEEHEHPMNHWPKVEGMNREDNGMGGYDGWGEGGWKRAWECDVGEALDRRWSGDETVSSSRVRGACEIGVFKRSHHVCMSGLQLFDMA